MIHRITKTKLIPAKNKKLPEKYGATHYSEWVQFVDIKLSASRCADVWIRTWGEDPMFITARIPDSVPQWEVANYACMRTIELGFHISWILWVKMKVASLRIKTEDVERFKLKLSLLQGEWMPAFSDYGRWHIENELKLGNFKNQ